MGTLFFPITESGVGSVPSSLEIHTQIFNSRSFWCCSSLHASPSLSCRRQMTTSWYDQIYDGIQKDPNKLKKSYSIHDSGSITFTLLAVKPVKKEKAGISPKALTMVNSHVAALSAVLNPCYILREVCFDK